MATVRIQVRRGTATQWSTTNPVLAAGEIGLETDTLKFKVGTGSTPWNSITAYANVVPGDLNNTLDGYLEVSDLSKDEGVGVAELLDGDLTLPGLNIIFEGTVDNHEFTLTAPDVTSDKTVTLPNATTTLVGTDTTDTLTNKTLTSPLVSGLTITDGSIIVEGTTADANETTLLFTDPTADRTITFPNATGTVAFTTDVDTRLALAGGTMAGAIAMGTNKITGLGAPTEAADAATKSYVDNTTAGLNFHAAVHAATTANLDAAYSNGTGGVGATLTANANGALVVDGHTLNVDERVLVKNQTAALQNGIYSVTTTGDVSNPFVLTRATDADNSPSGEVSYGDFTFVQQGTVNAGFGYIVNTTGTITIGTTAISYVQFNAGQVVVAGNGLTEATPGTLSINTGVTVDLNTAQTLTNKTLTSPVINTPTGISKSDVGLGNVDNTSDANKPVSTATQTALDLKAPLASPTFTGTVSGITATMVGLGNVDNTSDANKPVSTATQTALDLKANLASPTFTGTVTLPSGTVTSEMILDGTIVNADINASAAIALSKLATDPLARANHTGTQTASTVSDFDTQVRTSRLDQMAAPTTGVSLNSQKITSLASPEASTDAATKAYVDAVSEGLHIHPSCDAATSANVDISTELEAGDLVDGVTLVAGNRVLVKSQTDAAQNGIYVVQASGAALRASDFNEPLEVDGGDFVFVTGGTLYDNTGWVQTTTNVVTIGTDAIVFTQFSGAGTYTAGTGLSLAGTVFSIDTATTVDKTTAQTLTNKTLTSPVINTPTGITKSDVGLANVDNTSDANKPVSTATQTALDLKANLASPTFTGTVVLPNSTVTNDMLAGSIANNKLANSAITINGSAVSLGGTVTIASAPTLHTVFAMV